MNCPNCNKDMEDFAGLLWMCFDCELMLSENEMKIIELNKVFNEVNKQIKKDDQKKLVTKK